MFDHVSLAVSELGPAAAFYDALLGALGYVRLFENPRSVCYGPPGFTGEAPFAIVTNRGEPVVPAAASHMAFRAANRDEVQAAWSAATTAGGVDDGSPGVRENYDPGYYAAFVIDPDGHRVEVVVHE